MVKYVIAKTSDGSFVVIRVSPQGEDIACFSPNKDAAILIAELLATQEEYDGQNGRADNYLPWKRQTDDS